ncbi:MAG: ribonuclease J, partial [Roseicyclus sp.]|nr:ribonuclease J [Roseicyclus sp.]
GVLRERMKLALNGLVAVAVIVDEDDVLLEDSWVQLRGLPETAGNGADLAEMIEDALAEAMPRFDAKTVMDDDRLQEAVRRITRNLCLSEIGKKPEVAVLISRLMAA